MREARQRGLYALMERDYDAEENWDGPGTAEPRYVLTGRVYDRASQRYDGSRGMPVLERRMIPMNEIGYGELQALSESLLEEALELQGAETQRAPRNSVVVISAGLSGYESTGEYEAVSA